MLHHFFVSQKNNGDSGSRANLLCSTIFLTFSLFCAIIIRGHLSEVSPFFNNPLRFFRGKIFGKEE